jgi:hypothetical protein
LVPPHCSSLTYSPAREANRGLVDCNWIDPDACYIALGATELRGRSGIERSSNKVGSASENASCIVREVVREQSDARKIRGNKSVPISFNSLSEPLSSISPLAELNTNDRRVLGDDDFLGRIHAAAWQPRSRKTIDEVLDEATQRFAISHDRLIAPGRARLPAKARAWIAHQAVTLRIASLARVAALLGRDESTLRESVERYFPSA